MASRRQASRDRSPAPSENVFSDDYAIDSFGVADGYRPMISAENTPSSSRRQSRRPSLSRNATVSPEPKKQLPTTQTSTQPLISRNSFSLRHDAQYSDAPRRMPSVSSSAGEGRPMSMISRQSTLNRPQSTYAGPSAPSHPYGMYPQNATEMVHRASIASSSRPTRETSFRGADRPTHPYGMYSQTTSGEAEADPLLASTDIASIGFPGLRQDYARRLGPDGEEADDLIGPDGHREQLPPYTKYPDAGPLPRKAVAVATTSSAAPLSPIQQEPSSPRAANSATSMSDTLLAPSNDGASTDLPQVEESKRRRDKWSEKSKQRTCFGRIPIWLVCVVVLLLVALGAVLGGVVGRWLGRSTKQSSNSTTTSAIPDAAAAATSSVSFGGPLTITTTITGPTMAPTGSYHLILNQPSQTSNTCLEPDQQAAWDCMDGAFLKFTVENPPDSAAKVQFQPDLSTGLRYGDQPPTIEGLVSAMLQAGDSEDPASGPALYFNTTYDKNVLLHYQELNDTTSASKRSVESRDVLLPRDAKVNDADKVWNCWWNETHIDGYIYLDAPAQQAQAAISAFASAASAFLPGPSSTSAIHERRQIEYEDEDDFGYRRRHNQEERDAASTLSRADTYKITIPTDLYPQRVKIREFRMNSITEPYCILMQFSNGTLVPPLEGLHEIKLDELQTVMDRTAVLPHWQRRSLSSYDLKDVAGTGFCHCDWVIA